MMNMRLRKKQILSLGLRALWVGLLVFVLAMVGCESDDTDVAEVSKTAKEDKPKDAKKETLALDDGKAIGYVYAAENKRDPFKTYFDELLVQEKEQRNVSELQRFELGALTLVGVVAGTATPMALIEDPSGKGHTIKIGSLLGKNFGQVKQIRRGEIDVQEEFRDFTGKRIRSMKTLRLKPEEEIR